LRHRGEHRHDDGSAGNRHGIRRRERATEQGRGDPDGEGRHGRERGNEPLGNGHGDHPRQSTWSTNWRGALGSAPSLATAVNVRSAPKPALPGVKMYVHDDPLLVIGLLSDSKPLHDRVTPVTATSSLACTVTVVGTVHQTGLGLAPAAEIVGGWFAGWGCGWGCCGPGCGPGPGSGSGSGCGSGSSSSATIVGHSSPTGSDATSRPASTTTSARSSQSTREKSCGSRTPR